MHKTADILFQILTTLWVGGLWATGFLIAPILFSALPDKALAGMLAGNFFAAIAWVGIGCGTYLILFRLFRFGGSAFKQWAFWITLFMLLLTLLGHFGIQPLLAQLKLQAAKDVMETMMKSRFAVWHGVASILYICQSLMGAVLILKQGKAIQ